MLQSPIVGVVAFGRVGLPLALCAPFVDLPTVREACDVSPTSDSSDAHDEKQWQGFRDLIRKAQAGDREAMDQVLAILWPHLQQLARRYAEPLRHVASTADLLQESCLRAWNRLTTFQGGSEDEGTFEMFRAWIGQIIRRVGIDRTRELGTQRRRPEEKVLRLDASNSGDSISEGGWVDAPSREPSPSAYARSRELEERLQAALAGISDQTNASILRLNILDGLDLTEIADRLGISDETVRRRCWSTLQQIQHALKGSI